MNELRLVENKIDFFNNIIQRTILHIQINRHLNIILENDYNTCLQLLYKLHEKIIQLNDYIYTNYDKEIIIGKLQIINNELSSILKSYGTESFEKLLTVCFGNNKYIQTTDSILLSKIELLKSYFHPTGYKVVNHNISNNTISSSTNTNLTDENIINIVENDNNKQHFKCNDIILTSNTFYNKVYGMKVYVTNVSINKGLIIFGIVDNVVIELLNNAFIKNRLNMIHKHLPSDKIFNTESFKRYVSSLSLKDLFVYSHIEIYSKFFSIFLICPFISTNKISWSIKLLDIILKDSCSSENTRNLPPGFLFIISIIFSDFVSNFSSLIST